MVITIRVPVESGAAFLAGVDRFVNLTEREIPQTARRADAAIEMAEHAVATIDHPGATDGRYLVTLHLTPDVFADRPIDRHADDVSDDATSVVPPNPAGVPDDALRDFVPDEGTGPGCGAGPAAGAGAASGLRPDRDRRNVCCVAPGDGLTVHPAAVSRKTAERMLCDAVLQGYKIDGGDQPALGADNRFPSAKLKRALRLRDGGCMAPGCDRIGWTDSHHIIHWTNDGPTTASNLVGLCRFHHRLVHEGGWWITGDANVRAGLTFHRPDGTILPTGQQLVVGHAKAIDDIGCTAAAARPGACVHDQLDAIADTRHIRRRVRDLRRAVAA